MTTTATTARNTLGNQLAAYRDNTTIGERRTIAALLAVALRKGYTVSVNDGEEWTVKHSTSSDEITAALATTGEDVLRFRDKDKVLVGNAYLIYGNAADGSELVYDHTDEPSMNTLISQAGA